MYIELHQYWPCSNLDLGLHHIDETVVLKWQNAFSVKWEYMQYMGDITVSGRYLQWEWAVFLIIIMSWLYYMHTIVIWRKKLTDVTNFLWQFHAQRLSLSPLYFMKDHSLLSTGEECIITWRVAHISTPQLLEYIVELAPAK